MTAGQLLNAATTVKAVGLAGSVIGGVVQGSSEAKAARIAGRFERRRIIQAGQLASGAIRASGASRGVEGGSTLDLLASQASETAKDYAISRYNQRVGESAGRARMFQSVLGGVTGAAELAIGHAFQSSQIPGSSRLNRRTMFTPYGPMSPWWGNS